MERLVALSSSGEVIRASGIPAEYSGRKAPQGPGPADGLKDACREFERRYITAVLRKTDWNRSEAAHLMKVHRNTLLLKMKGLEITDAPTTEACAPETSRL